MKPLFQSGYKILVNMLCSKNTSFPKYIFWNSNSKKDMVDFRRRGFCEYPGRSWGEVNEPPMRLMNIFRRQGQDVYEVQSKAAPSGSFSTFISTSSECEKWIPIIHKLLGFGQLLQQPEETRTSKKDICKLVRSGMENPRRIPKVMEYWLQRTASGL